MNNRKQKLDLSVSLVEKIFFFFFLWSISCLESLISYIGEKNKHCDWHLILKLLVHLSSKWPEILGKPNLEGRWGERQVNIYFNMYLLLLRTIVEPTLQDESEFLYESQPELLKYRTTELSVELVTDWYLSRAQEIEKYAMQVSMQGNDDGCVRWSVFFSGILS